MIKSLVLGLWVCAAAMGSAYAGVAWQRAAVAKESYDRNSPQSELTPLRTRMISVPVVADGGIRGYVVAQFAFTAPAKLLKHLPIKPDMFVVDEAFQLIFAGETVDFRQFKKQDLVSLSKKIAENVNKRLGMHVVEDVLVQELNYVPKDSVRGGMK